MKASSLLQTIHDTSHHGDEQDLNIYFYAIAQCYSSLPSQIERVTNSLWKAISWLFGHRQWEGKQNFNAL